MTAPSRNRPARERRVAFVTYDAKPELTDDDALAVAPLARRGITVRATSWSDPAARWDEFDAVVLRSSWDYYRRIGEFTAWLDRLGTCGVPVWNPMPVLRWNLSKHYLDELRHRGVQVVPTEIVPGGTDLSLASIRARRGWDSAELVIKPAVSAGGHETWRVAAEATDEERFAALTASADIMVQPFLQAIEQDGEWSLLFFGGEYSHAVRKRPAADEFRVQSQYGGTSELAVAPPAVVRQAEEILARAPGPQLYARVDGCLVDGTLVLMELELLEPSLFLGESAGAAERFADALDRCVRGA